MLDYHDTLALVIPTNEPDVAKDYFLATLHNLASASDFITILFNFQEPWTVPEAEEAVRYCRDLGFAVKYKFTPKGEYKVEAEGEVPFNRIRGDAADLMPNAKYYMLIDDDFYFLSPDEKINKYELSISSGDCYLAAIHYLLDNPKCGVLLLKSGIRKPRIPGTVAPKYNNIYITDRGIILKNISNDVGDSGLVVPKAAISLVGSDEEKLASAWRIYNGYYPAVFYGFRNYHYEIHRGDYNAISSTGRKPVEVISGEKSYNWNKRSIIRENVEKFIIDNYNINYKHKSGPAELVDYQQYLNSGGLDILNNPSYHYDYRELLTEDGISDLIDSIKEMLEQ